MRKVVSVIVPVYNCEKYIKKCLKSILSQTYADIEILVVNDGSTDNSQKIIDNFAQDDERIHRMYQKNQGVAAARNYALSCAKGDYYLFVDGDDYVGKDYVKDLVHCAQSNQSDMVICGYTLVYSNRGKSSIVMPGIYKKNEHEEWAYRICSVCGRLYASEFWKKHELHFITEKGARAEDVPIALYYNAMADNICVIRKTDYYYVQREGSAMNSKKRVPFLFPYIAFKEMYNKISHNKITNSKIFFDMGVLKFLAQFKYVIYMKADKEEKKKFDRYNYALLNNDIIRMNKEWKKLRKNIDLPFSHKIAISLFARYMLAMCNHNIKSSKRKRLC